MQEELIEKCAEALWFAENKDPANQYKYSKIFKRSGPFTWRDANDPDIIPNIAGQFRARAVIVLEVARKHILKNVTKRDADKALADIYTMLIPNGE